MTWIIVLLLCVLIGAALGLLGSGGAILLVPLLVYVMGVEAGQAIPMSLAVVGLTSTVAAVVHARRGNFHLRATVTIGIAGAGGAVVGSQLTHLLPEPVVMMFFAVIMAVSGVTMLRRGPLEAGRSCRVWPCMGIGLAGGLLMGFLGGGGAMIILPGMVLLAGVPMHQAVGASLAIIAMNAFAALVGHLQVTAIAWGATAVIATATLLGMAAGTALALRITEAATRRVFAWLLLVLGMIIAVRSAGALLAA